MTFRVRVTKQGNQIGKPFYVTATTALEAMDEVESKLGLKPPVVSVDNSTGKLFVTKWHGYEFSAKQIS